MAHKMQQLQELAAKNGPLCVGLDTDPSYIPESVLKNYRSAPDAVLAYNKEIIRRVAADKSACCCKVQIAYYEAMGLEGMKVYAETLRAVKDSGLICISDIKRGDIAATASAYARAHFTGDFETDIITINPYMGFDTLQPFTEYCAEEKGGKGIFVLLCTSNPGMVDIEHQELKSGGLLLNRVGDEIKRICDTFAPKSERNEENVLQNGGNANLNVIEGDANPNGQTGDGQGNSPVGGQFGADWCGPVGAVVGATQEADARTLRDLYPNTFFLIPGYGAQGGAAKIAATLLDKAGGTVNSSRGILCAYKKDELCAEKLAAGTLTMEDIADAAQRNAMFSKKDILGFMG